jgi:molecular chaperone HtpG
MTQERHGFQAEVSRLLHIVAHSLYSDKSVFLRELISNASDACDKLRYLALTQPELLEGGGELAVTLTTDKTNKHLTIADNGIGMNRDDLIEPLGTIARSGTQASSSPGTHRRRGKKVLTLIGQFGVGFYSAFMVANRSTSSRARPARSQGWRWVVGRQGRVHHRRRGEARPRHRRSTLHLEDDADEFLEAAPPRQHRGRKTYSDHIGLPDRAGRGRKEQTINAASALWTLPKGGHARAVPEFYRHVGHLRRALADPAQQGRGQVVEYTAAVRAEERPFDLFIPSASTA